MVEDSDVAVITSNWRFGMVVVVTTKMVQYL